MSTDPSGDNSLTTPDRFRADAADSAGAYAADAAEESQAGSFGSPQGPGGHGVDSQLVQRTRHEVGQIVQEISQLAGSEAAPGEFFERFLQLTVSALAAVGGAIWERDPQHRFHLVRHVSLPQTGLAAEGPDYQSHRRLIEQALHDGRPRIVGPHSGTAETDEGTNPTPCLLVIDLVRDDTSPRYVVEIFQRSGSGLATQRGYARFLAQVCELAGMYVKNQRLKHFGQRDAFWSQLERFLFELHRSLDPQKTAFTIANEARRLLQCDRASVAVCRGGRCQVTAVSGVEQVDRRSEQVRDVERLIREVVPTGQPLRYPAAGDEHSDRVADRLKQYTDLAQPRRLTILPLRGGADESKGGTPLPGGAASAASDAAGQAEPPAIGALVLEDFESSESARPADHGRRAEVVAQHSAVALANSREHAGIFLMPIWQGLGRAAEMLHLRNLPKTAFVLACLTAAVIALCVVPAEFELQGRGKLQPQIRRKVFAGINGDVVDVQVEHGQQVAAGQPLAKLRNVDLEVAVARVIGQRTAAQEEILSVSRALLEEHRLTEDRQNELAGRLEQLKQTLATLDAQLDLLRKKQEFLAVKSPIRGRVVTWDVRDKLIHRPVQTGQALLTVVDPESDWELEVYMPENRMGHVAAAYRQARQKNEPLKVTFHLATHPGETFTGTVREIHGAADLRGDAGNSVLVRVAIDKNQLPDLRPGASVTAKVDCGQRPLGYAWFHDVIAFVQGKVLFWL